MINCTESSLFSCFFLLGRWSVLWFLLHLYANRTAEEIRAIFVLGALSCSLVKEFHEAESSTSSFMITNDSNIQNFSAVLEELIKMPLLGIPVKISNNNWSGPSRVILVSLLLNVHFVSVDNESTLTIFGYNLISLFIAANFKEDTASSLMASRFLILKIHRFISGSIFFKEIKHLFLCYLLWDAKNHHFILKQPRDPWILLITSTWLCWEIGDRLIEKWADAWLGGTH